jgi:hypothetical protein
MVKELEDMLRIIFDDFGNPPQPITMNVLVEHIDSGPAEDPGWFLQFIGCHELLLIEPNSRIVVEACVDAACVTEIT